MAGRQLFLSAATLCVFLISGYSAWAQDVEAVAEEAAVAENVFRLPANIHPLHYKLRIVTHLDDEEGFKFTGKVWIKVSGVLDGNNL